MQAAKVGHQRWTSHDSAHQTGQKSRLER